MWDQGKRESHKQIYTGSLLHQELHPVPRNYWVSTMQSKSRLQTHHQRSDLEQLKTHTSFGTPTPQKLEHPLIMHLHTNIKKYKRYKKDCTWWRSNQKIIAILFHFFEKIQKLECKSLKLKSIFTLSQMSQNCYLTLREYNNLF